jgi:hypothetical protein
METTNILIGIVLALFVIGIATLLTMNEFKQKKLRIENEKKFVNIMFTCLLRKSLRTLDDIKDLYLAHFESENISNWKLLLFLQKTKLEVSQTESLQEKEDERVTYLDFLSAQITETESLIRKQEEEQPFQRVNGFEKSLLLELNILSKGKEHEQLVYQKLTDLSKILVTRQETVDKLTQDNKVALNNSRWSITITIILSVISIGLGIFALTK